MRTTLPMRACTPNNANGSNRCFTFLTSIGSALIISASTNSWILCAIYLTRCFKRWKNQAILKVILNGSKLLLKLYSKTNWLLLVSNYKLLTFMFLSSAKSDDWLSSLLRTKLGNSTNILKLQLKRLINHRKDWLASSNRPSSKSLSLLTRKSATLKAFQKSNSREKS